MMTINKKTPPDRDLMGADVQKGEMSVNGRDGPNGQVAKSSRRPVAYESGRKARNSNAFSSGLSPLTVAVAVFRLG